MRDDLAWLGPAVFQPANADPPITPPSAIRNQAKLGRAIDGGFSVQVRKDVLDAFRAKREAKAAEALDGIYTDIKAGTTSTPPATRARETKMAKRREGSPTAEDLKAYLLEHGPTTREELLSAVGFRDAYKNDTTARSMLNKAVREIGAVNDGRRYGPLRLPDQPSTPAPKARKRPAPAPASDDTEHEDIASLNDAIAELTDATLALARAQERHRKAIEAVKAWAKS